MYKKFILIALSFLALSCTEKTHKKEIFKIEERKSGKYLFDFDSVEHYFMDISESESTELSIMEHPSKKEKALSEILENDKMDYTDKLEYYGFKKTRISESNFSTINEIFSENKCETGYVAACIPVYRDIFIFKKAGKTIGKAKICFGCRVFYIEGTKLNIDNFGQCGDFERLEKLLKSNT